MNHSVFVSQLRQRILIHREMALACPDPAVWIYVASEEQLLAQWKDVSERLANGESLPLAGLLYAIKDNIDCAQWPTTAACPEFVYTATTDATTVARLRKAGAIALGKTNLDQFATGLVGTRSPYGAVQNVFSAQHISGGSSSGSAAAVTRRIVDFALGTDTAGSGRIPAAFGNLVGLKPTRGAWPTTGVVPACQSLDCVSVFTHDTLLAKKLWELLIGDDGIDPYARERPTAMSAHRVRKVGIPTQLPFSMDARFTALWDGALQRLKDLGCELVPFDFEDFSQAARLLYEGPWTAERWESVGAFVESHPQVVYPITEKILRTGKDRQASELFRALHKLEGLKKTTQKVWDNFDIFCLPTAGILPTHADIAQDPVGINSELGKGTNFCNLLDLSALAMPAGFSNDHLPFGVTFFGAAFADLQLLDIGQKWESISISSPLPDVRLAVAGLHLHGEPLNHELTKLGGILEQATKTSAKYRAFKIVRGERKFPGLIRTETESGASIDVEVWRLPPAGAGQFLANCVRPPLCLGTVELLDGSTVMGFLCEDWATKDSQDITSFGGWRQAKGN